MKPAGFLALLILILAGACSPGAEQDTALPRRYAYPRFEAYDSVSVPLELGALRTRVNARAEVRANGSGWADIRYPRYGATLHVTVSHNPSREAAATALANRHERMALNLGDARGVATTYSTPVGFDCEEILAPDALVTPLQFIATDSRGHMLSGAAVFDNPEAPADSLAPILDELGLEVRRMLQSLSIKP